MESFSHLGSGRICFTACASTDIARCICFVGAFFFGGLWHFITTKYFCGHCCLAESSMRKIENIQVDCLQVDLDSFAPQMTPVLARALGYHSAAASEGGEAWLVVVQQCFSASPFCSSFAAPSPLGRTAAEELQTGASCLRGKRLILFYSWSLSLGYRFLRPPAGPLYIDAQNKGSSGCFIGQHRRP